MKDEVKAAIFCVKWKRFSWKLKFLNNTNIMLQFKLCGCFAESVVKTCVQVELKNAEL